MGDNEIPATCELTIQQQQEFDENYKKALTSYPFYAQTQLKIQTTEGDLKQFQFNEIQWLLEEIEADIFKQGRLIRQIILKARREGVSTYITGKFFWRVANKRNRYACMVTHEPEATDFLFKMQKRYYDYLNPEFKPATKYNNVKMLEFNNAEGKGLDSAIRVGTAGKSDFGSAQLIHYLHLSETTKWPEHTEQELLTSLLQCVPREQDTAIIFESTAKGIGGEFYKRFWSSRYRYEIYLSEHGTPAFKCTVNEQADPNNVYSSIFIPWFVFSKYQMEVPPGFTRTDEEKQLTKLYGLTDKQLQWRRWAIENDCGRDTDTFKQEYPSNAKEAFLSSGRPVFPVPVVMSLIENAPKPKVRYECALSTGQFLASDTGALRVWSEPIAGKTYLIGADVAEGLEKGDFSCADIIEHLTGLHVAQWHGHIDPDRFAQILMWLGKRYNTAWLVPERNNHGLVILSKLQDFNYPRIFVEIKKESPHKRFKRYGWLTTRANKPLIIDNLVGEVRDGTHYIQATETFEEMLSFKHGDTGEMEAEEGMFDDRIMSMAIAKFARKMIPISNMASNYGGPQPKPIAAPPISAWT